MSKKLQKSGKSIGIYEIENFSETQKNRENSAIENARNAVISTICKLENVKFSKLELEKTLRKMVGIEKLLETRFRLAEAVRRGADSENLEKIIEIQELILNANQIILKLLKKC